MPSCVIPTCKHATGRTNDNQEISFHRFPADDETREKWVDIVRKSRLKENWNPKVQSVICSAHFDESNIYETQNNLKRVKKGAIPIHNIATVVAEACDDSSDGENDKDLAQLKSELQSQPDSTMDTDDDLNIDNLKHITNTPSENNLRIQIHSRIKYINKYKCKIKLLKEKNAEIDKNTRKMKEAIIKYIVKSITEE